MLDESGANKNIYSCEGANNDRNLSFSSGKQTSTLVLRNCTNFIYKSMFPVLLYIEFVNI